MPDRNNRAEQDRPDTLRAYLLLGILCTSYIGIYLCRKNLSVAVPLLGHAWGLSKERLGLIGSVSTLTYAFGKFFFGPITDRIGGRNSLCGSMFFVALFGAAGALSPGLGVLVLVYSANRLCGAACWGAMVKLVSDWFSPARLAFACGLLSLSYVFGGALSVAFAGLVARLSHDSWHAVLAWPSAVLLLLLLVSWWIIPRQKAAQPAVRAGLSDTRTPNTTTTAPKVKSSVFEILRQRRFLIVLALSFTLTLLRETFNFWSVDFMKTEGGPNVSSALAAVLSTPFDLCGAAGIIFMGWSYGRLSGPGRRTLLVSMLLVLAALLVVLPFVFHAGLWLLAAGIGAIGFLVYGPYSLLAGVLSVEVSGKEHAATVSGWVDGIGYFAGFLSGVLFGRLLTLGGYRLGFGFMAALTLLSAVQCLFLYRERTSTPNAEAEAAAAINET